MHQTHAHQRYQSVVERLPFNISIARSEDDIASAIEIRRSAYGRHVPELAATMTNADALDCQGGTVILLAKAKLDGAPIGTLRIQAGGPNPLLLERSVELPEPYQGARRAEATRLGICVGRIGRVAKAALYKAFYLHCVAEDIEYMVVAGRHPVDRDYVGLRFRDVFDEGAMFPMAHAGNTPHRVLALRVPDVKRVWENPRHPLYRFFFESEHPDIQLERGMPEFVGAKSDEDVVSSASA